MGSVYLRVVGIYTRVTVPMFGPMPMGTVADILRAATL